MEKDVRHLLGWHRVKLMIYPESSNEAVARYHHLHRAILNLMPVKPYSYIKMDLAL